MDAAVKELTGDFGTWVEITEAIDREAKKVERLKNLHKESHEWPPHQERGFYQDRLKRMRRIQELIQDYDVLASLVMGKKSAAIELYPLWVRLTKAVKAATGKVEAVVRRQTRTPDATEAADAWQRALEEIQKIQEMAHDLRAAWHIEAFAPT